MIVSRNWLTDYVALPEDVETLTERLTMSGLNLEEFHAVGDDVAIDLEVTSNRADCLGHLGVAREVSVLFDEPLRIPEARPDCGSEPTADATSVAVECPELCHEYHARVIRGVRIGPSPAWLVERLAAVGVTSVNNVVDVTNYVMLECGQPLHAFDYDTLHEGRIVVRRARRGETITAIDQRAYELPEGACVIADADRAVAVAGVMGGLDTEISDSTVNVLLESASFDPVSIRSTARSLKLHSPSSYRFERRVDRRQLDWASRRCCELILQVAGGTLLDGSVAACPVEQPDPQPIPFRFEQIPRLLGISIPARESVRILEQLGLSVTQQNEERAEFLPPSWRGDLRRECDLVEEVARIHGYQEIPDSVVLPEVATARSPRERVIDRLQQILAADGVHEAMTLTFVSEELVQAVRPHGDIPVMSVSHSSRVHESQLRQTLIPSLLQCRRLNERHGNPETDLYEIARVFLSPRKDIPEADAEPTVLGVISGRTFLRLKGLVELLVSDLTQDQPLDCRPLSADYLTPGRGAELWLDGHRLGWIGELSAAVREAFGLRDAVMAAELNLNHLLPLSRSGRTVQPIPRFPSILRDLNFVIPEQTPWSDLSRAVVESGGEWLQDVRYSGQYRSSGIGADRKSYVVTCRFGADDRTLKAEDVDAAVSAIVAECQTRLSASLRA